MLRWLNFILGGLLALRLHTGTITPLQLTLKLGDTDYRNQGAISLMDSIDLNRCFDAVIYLVNLKTCRFREYVSRTCKDRFSLDRMKRYDRVTTAWNLGLAKLMGVDCIAKIEDYGKLFPIQSLDSKPVNSWTKMINLSKLQIEEVLMELSDPDKTNDILFTGFLMFDRVLDVEIVSEMFHHYRALFDGPFTEFNSNYTKILVHWFLKIESRSRSYQGIDISELPSGKFCRKAYSLIKDKIGVAQSSIDMISRFLQLATTFMYTSNSCRACLATEALARIKSTVMTLFDFVMVHYKSFGGWSLEVRAAAHLARTTVEPEFTLKVFHGLVFKSGYGKESGFYEMILDMTEQILDTEDVINREIVSMITRMKIESLVLLSRFSIAPEKMLEFVDSILQKKRYRGRIKKKPLCRHLLVLLWALGSDQKIYNDSCKLIMSYILHHMPSGTDLSAFKRLKVLKYAPLKVLMAGSRQDMLNDLTEEMFHETVPLVNFWAVQFSHPDLESSSMRNQSGYLDFKAARKVILPKIVAIIHDSFVYCGHHDGIPVYIQSLGCHKAVSSLLQLLIVMASGLRLKLPFTLHPAMVSKVVEPENENHVKDYLMVSVRYEFNGAMSKSLADTKVTRILALLEQTNNNLKTDQYRDGYEDWESIMTTFHRWTFEKKLSVMKERLKVLGTDMVKQNVMPISLDGKFETALLLLPGLQNNFQL